MEFATAGGERMRIDSAGRVGIGTNSPSAPLTVNGTNAGIRFTDASQNVSNYYGEIYKDYNGNAPFIIQSKSNGIGVIALNPDGGNVGIGTNSPTFKLHQSGTGLQRFQIDATDNNVNGSGVYLRVLNSGSVVSQSTIAIDNVGNLKFFTGTSSEAERVRIDALGRVGIGTTSPATYGKFAIRGGVTVNAGSTSLTGTSFSTSDAANATFWINHASATTNLVTDASMAFYTASGSGVAERMRIDTSGNLLVRSNGATPSSSQAGISLGLSGPNGGKILIANTLTGTFAGAMVFVNGNGQVGSIATSGSATSYVTSSDQRLKESIIDADDAGNKIDAIQVRQFDWKVDGEHQDYGMVAQELQSVAPEAVSGDADSEEMMGVDYSKLVPMLIKEIQSLRQRVASLEG